MLNTKYIYIWPYLVQKKNMTCVSFAYQVHSILETRVVFLQSGKFGGQVSSEAVAGVVTRHHWGVVVSKELLYAGVLTTVLPVLLTKPMGKPRNELLTYTCAY